MMFQISRRLECCSRCRGCLRRSALAASAALIVGAQMRIFLSCQPRIICHILLKSAHFFTTFKQLEWSGFFFFFLHESVGFHVKIRPKFEVRSLVFL